EFNLGLALVGFLSMTALLGLNQAVARTLSYETDPGERRVVVRYGILVSVAASFVASSLVYLGAQPLSVLFRTPELVLVFQLFSVTIGFTILSQMLASVFQGFEDTSPNAWFNQVINPGLFVVFLIAAIYLHFGFTGALVANVLASAVSLSALTVYTLRRLPKLLVPATTVPKRPKPGLWDLSAALWGVSSLAFVTAYVDTIILGVFRPETDVGLYSTAMTLARLLLVGSGALTYIFLPVAARLVREKDYSTLRATFVTSTRWTVALTLPMFLLFGFDPTLSIDAVFGAKFVSSALALQVLVVGSFISAILGPVNSCMAGMGYARALLATTVLSAGINLVASLALIPTFGLLGAAVAWSVARVAYPGAGLISLYYTDKITPFRSMLNRPLVLSLLLASPVYLVASWMSLPHWAVIPLYAFGFGVFVAAILITKSLDSGDLVAASALERVLKRPLPGLRNFLGRYIADNGRNVGTPVP
ncbi:MAG: polysaccharide biosynthesis C-terminal domain-containing protein, partial [Thermoplasmata archaeon]|nr:polysaccharide biosynthesis C-terminal domain-containing protein [Thermoplasmata archaeon]